MKALKNKQKKLYNVRFYLLTTVLVIISFLWLGSCSGQFIQEQELPIDTSIVPVPISMIDLGTEGSIEFVEIAPGELMVAALFNSPETELTGIEESPLKVYENFTGKKAPTELTLAYVRSREAQQNSSKADLPQRTSVTEPAADAAGSRMSGSDFEAAFCAADGDFDWMTYTGCRTYRTGLWRIQRNCYTMGAAVSPYRGTVHFRIRTLYNSGWSTFYERDINQGAYYKVYIGGSWRTRMAEVTDATDDGYHVAFRGDPVLIRTRWAQDGLFAQDSPNKVRLGCWSTAFAQIMNHYQLQPTGNVSYTCSDATQIRENVGSPAVNWNLIAPELNAATPANIIAETARYSYNASVIVQKDFGTGTYVIGTNAILQELENHYGLSDASVYASPGTSLADIEAIIKTEIDARRPVFLYLQNAAHTTAHAMVIDEYNGSGNTFSIHINMGGGGNNDGFYNFYGQIRQWDDNDYRRIVTIHP